MVALKVKCWMFIREQYISNIRKTWGGEGQEKGGGRGSKRHILFIVTCTRDALNRRGEERGGVAGSWGKLRRGGSFRTGPSLKLGSATKNRSLRGGGTVERKIPFSGKPTYIQEETTPSTRVQTAQVDEDHRQNGRGRSRGVDTSKKRAALKPLAPRTAKGGKTTGEKTSAAICSGPGKIQKVSPQMQKRTFLFLRSRGLH